MFYIAGLAFLAFAALRLVNALIYCYTFNRTELIIFTVVFAAIVIYFII